MTRSLRAIALLATAALIGIAATASAQDEPPPVEVDIVGGGVKSNVSIAVPVMPVAAGADATLGRQVAEVIASDLRSTGLFTPLGPNGIGGYSYDQAATPAYAEWRSAGAAQLVSGYVEGRGDGKITVGCYLHDVTAGRELTHNGFAVAAADWRA